MVIPPFCKGHDVILQDPSGTGMSATFCIGILKMLDYELAHCQALVLAPTNELALQIKQVMQDLGQFHGVRIHACVGGISAPVEDLQRFMQVGYSVYDMDGEGFFREGIDKIFQLLPYKIQVGVISSTMPPEALEITRKFMKKPVTIQAKRDELTTLEGIKQFYVNVDEEKWKLETLYDIYTTKFITHCIVFVNTERKVDWLMDKMRSRYYTVLTIHDDMDQNTRDIIVRNFQSGSPQILITTDPLVYGLDVQEVSLVINYDLPTLPENYLHRICHKGRFGRKGVAINFVTLDDFRMLSDIQKLSNVIIEELPSNFADLLS
ncbi:putative RNA helicase [Medicago truncatula]|uniref:RNA helicase n=1 Tax=Medicago truncatula TaxID=3880 RepID=A0A396GD09_MEDTR|nr:putative RNA helicase [Medicago truncatula]